MRTNPAPPTPNPQSPTPSPQPSAPSPQPPTPTPRVSVLVVTWNGRDHVRRCLDGLRRQTFRDFEVVVVDNASRDGTVEMLAHGYPEVRLIRNPDNLGFAVANNQGIRATESELVATLNNDAVPEPGWLAALVGAADSSPAAGSVASKMVFAHDPGTINSCGIALDPAGIAWDLDGGLPSRWADRPREVFGPCAGAALYRRAMLEDVGLFAEEFFLYLEDVDLAWRAQLRGWSCVFAPDAVVRHAHAATLGEGSPVKRFLLARNKVWTIARNLSSEDLGRWLPVILLYDVGAATFAAARQRDGASLRGRLAGLLGLPRALRERRYIQGRRTAAAAAVRARYAPLALPWDVPRRYRHLAALPLDPPLPPGEADPSARKGARTGEGALRPAGAQDLAGLQDGRLRARIRLALLRVAGRMLNASPPKTSPSRGDGLASSPSTGRLANSQCCGPDPGQAHRVAPPTSALPLDGGGSKARSPRILVIRPDHLGDVLLSRPALEAMRRALPHSEITVVVGPWGAASLRGFPGRVAEYAFPGFSRAPKRHALAPYGQLLALAARLRRERYAAAIVLRPDHWWGALAAALAGVPVRVGLRTAETTPFLTHPVEPRGPEHAADTAIRLVAALARALGTKTEPEAPVPRFEPTARGAAVAEALLPTESPRSRPLVLLHPGAGARTKLWPAQRWAALCRALESDADVLLCAGPGDETDVEAIRQRVGPGLRLLSGLSWDELAAVFQRVDAVVGVDSGPLHLAAAVGTPTVRAYGPTDPRIHGPRGGVEPHRALQGPLPCVPCGNIAAPPCGYAEAPPCMASISIEAFTGAVREVLSLSHHSGRGEGEGHPRQQQSRSLVQRAPGGRQVRRR